MIYDVTDWSAFMFFGGLVLGLVIYWAIVRVSQLLWFLSRW